MRKKETKSAECKHRFVKYPPKIGKLKVCTKCGFLWVLGDVKFGTDTIKLSGSGNYIESSTTTAPANPVSGKIRLYATSGTSLRMRNSTGTETDLAAAGGDLYNFLTNPGFDIWQRGAGAFTASNAYTADRWLISIAGTDTLSVSRDSSVNLDTDSPYSAACTFTLGSGAGATQIRQVLNSNAEYLAWQLRGRTLTLRIRVKANAANAIRSFITTDGTGGTTTYSGYHTGGSTFESLDVTVTAPTSVTIITVGVVFAATVTAYLDNATLVVGSTAQTYYPLHPADEWERCQRYYYKEEFVSVNDSWLIRGNPAATPFYVQRGINYPVAMAVRGTLTKNGTWEVGNAGQPNFDSYDTKTQSSMLLTATAQGHAYALMNTTDDNFTVEANP